MTVWPVHSLILVDDETEQAVEFIAWADDGDVVLEHPIAGGRHRHRFLVSEAEQLLELVSEAIGDAEGAP